MAFSVDRLMRAWREPPADDAAAEAAFRELYADPVVVNGVPLSVADLVARARSLHRTYAAAEWEILDVLESAGQVAVAFRMRGRQAGPLPTSLGTVAPTGRAVELRVIDILTITDGRVSGVWMVADELGLLTQLGAVALVEGAGSPVP
jgi:predicted ester cyclase